MSDNDSDSDSDYTSVNDISDRDSGRIDRLPSLDKHPRLDSMGSSDSIPREWRRATLGPSDGRIRTGSVSSNTGLKDDNEEEEDEQTNAYIPKEWRRASMTEIGKRVEKHPPKEWAAQEDDEESARKRVRSLKSEDVKDAMEDMSDKMGFAVPDAWASMSKG